jgi:hypothetical protein
MIHKKNTVSSNTELHTVPSNVTAKVTLHPIDVDPLNKDKGFVVSQQNFEETKKLLQTFKPHLKKQITYMSYEGSVVVLVRLALSKGEDTVCVVAGLPKIDRDTINEVVPEGFLKESFFVSLNKYKDFEMKFIKPVNVDEHITSEDLDDIMDELDKEAETGIYCDFSSKFKRNDKVKEVFIVEFINTVQNPRYEDIHSDEVDVEDNGVKVKVDGLPLNKKLVEKVVNGELPILLPDSNGFYTPTPKSTPLPITEVKSVNKNAYEIRESILAQSIHVVNSDSVMETKNSDLIVDKILNVASKFYEFVENKNRYNK